MTSEDVFATPRDAANDPRVLVFGRLLGAANRFEFILGRSLEDATGLSHTLFELLLVVGRAGAGGISLRDIAQARVLTSGGVTRLVDRATREGLLRRQPSPEDGRVQLVTLTPHGERVLLDATVVHVRNIETLLLDALTPEQIPPFSEAIKTLSKTAAALLPPMP